jgi:hypothetical protein
MKKKMFILVPFALLTILAMIAPVLACQVNRNVSFTAVAIGSNVPGPNYVNIVTDDNIRIVKDLLGSGIISLWISPNAYPSTPNLKGTTSATISSITNQNTGQGWIEFQMTWTFAGGTFKGILVGKLVGPPGNQLPTAYAITDVHGILVGSGVFKGQIAIFIGSKPVGQPFSWTGTIATA